MNPNVYSSKGDRFACAKCGEDQNSQSGICSKCRKTKCRICGKQYMMQGFSSREKSELCTVHRTYENLILVRKQKQSPEKYNE